MMAIGEDEAEALIGQEEEGQRKVRQCLFSTRGWEFIWLERE